MSRAIAYKREPVPEGYIELSGGHRASMRMAYAAGVLAISKQASREQQPADDQHEAAVIRQLAEVVTAAAAELQPAEV